MIKTTKASSPAAVGRQAAAALSAFCGAALLLFHCGNNLLETEKPPVLAMAGDSVVSIADSLQLRFSSPNAARSAIRCVWFIDDPSQSRVTSDSVVFVRWTLADSGRHVIVARAVAGVRDTSLPCSLVVRVYYTRPVVKPLPDTSVKINDTLVLHFSARDSISPIARYRYFVDTPSHQAITAGGSAAFIWAAADTGRHLFVLTAQCRDSVWSLPDTSIVFVTCRRPLLVLRRDTTAGLFDSVRFSAEASDPDGVVDHFLWSIDDMANSLIVTKTGSLHWAFAGTAENFHTVRAAAVDNDGLLSALDSIRVHVLLRRPDLRLSLHDTTVYAGQTVKVRATAQDSFGTIAQYRWAIDGRPAGSGPRQDSINTLWTVSGTGRHFVTCTAVDDDSIASLPDTCTIVIMAGYPRVTATRDTAVSSLDSVRISCSASDPNGFVVRYLWGFSGIGWDDSSAAPYRWLHYGGREVQRVLVGARDNDGLLSVDTTVVTWNRPPDTISISRPRTLDTVVFSCTAPRCTVSFVWSSPDPDHDTVTSSLFWGPAPDSMAIVYQGTGGAAQVAVAQTGKWYWRLAVRDAFGSTRARSGTIVAVREYRICFIGHSIVTGCGGNGISGGFRGGVIDSLRKSLREYERLKAVGPLTTTFMSRSAVDDSCLAINGSTAREIYLILTNTVKQLTADIWVLMIGVNDNFNPGEVGYTNYLIDTMIARNPAGRLYVMNSPPVPENYYLAKYYLPFFNKSLVDSAAVRTMNGKHESVIDLYTQLGNNGSYDPAWFADDLHPNQNGYDRMVNLIFSTMKSSRPPALP